MLIRTFLSSNTARWVILFLVFWANLANASPQKNSNVNTQTPILEKQATTCLSPSFWLKNNCWVILKEEEDCLVEPIIMELEDQPVYCPKSKIKKINKMTTTHANDESKHVTNYAIKLKKLQAKDIKEEVRGVIAMGSYYLLGYKSGNNFILPGLNQEQQQNNKQCKIVLLDELNEPTQEKTYLKYKQAVIDYASDFNHNLIKFCKF